MPTGSIFRFEALEANSRYKFGAITVAQPLSARLAVVAAIIIGMCVATFITVGTIASKARISGVLMPQGGLINVTAMESGMVTRILKHEGEVVAPGEGLFEITTERLTSSGGITALVGAQLAARQENLRSEEHIRASALRNQQKALQGKIEALVDEEAHLQKEIGLAERSHQLAEKSFDKYRALLADGFISSLQAEQKEQAAIELESKITELRRSMVQLRTQRATASAELADVIAEFRMADLRLQSSAASLAQDIAENQGRRAVIISAPYGGRITGLSAVSGATVSPGQPMATIVPMGGTLLEANLYAPSKMIGFIAVGQPVLFRYDAYPYEKYGLHRGRVTDISLSPFAPAELPSGSAASILRSITTLGSGSGGSESLFRIKVALDSQSVRVGGNTKPLRPGMVVVADIVHEKRKIWEWIAAPILAAKQRS